MERERERERERGRDRECSVFLCTTCSHTDVVVTKPDAHPVDQHRPT